MNLADDLQNRWLPSSEQMTLADALLTAGWTAERSGKQGAERGVYTAHLLINKEYGFWTEKVELVFLDGVFLTREAVLIYVHEQARFHHEMTGLRLTGGWSWHMAPGEAAVFEDIVSRFPE